MSDLWLLRLKGALRSLSVYFAAFLAAWPDIGPLLKGVLVPTLVAEDNWTRVCSLIGALIVLALRVRTKEALEDKALPRV